MAKITPCLWFDGNAEEAANFYSKLLPGSSLDAVIHAPADNPSTAKGAVLLVKFTVAGQKFLGLNGGPHFKFTEAVSFTIDCEDQAEIDHLWDTLISGGGEEKDCGWLKDRFGLFWQIVPKVLPQSNILIPELHLDACHLQSIRMTARIVELQTPSALPFA